RPNVGKLHACPPVRDHARVGKHRTGEEFVDPDLPVDAGERADVATGGNHADLRKIGHRRHADGHDFGGKPVIVVAAYGVVAAGEKPLDLGQEHRVVQAELVVEWQLAARNAPVEPEVATQHDVVADRHEVGTGARHLRERVVTEELALCKGRRQLVVV